ncbi:hypothetical protein [Alicyclobacillus fodiniaquatilis]|uniref:Tetratricopeptide repeat protein n=1 Tax=Alicyclobacillus fodiniaquatilis TaxID=1661150 RepID=A0ABW4JB09_9BACL
MDMDLTVAKVLRDEAITDLNCLDKELDRGIFNNHDGRLATSAEKLWRAYQMGLKESSVVWALKNVWSFTGNMDRTTELLKDYMTATPDPEERFRACHYLVDTYALWAQKEGVETDTQAVSFHRRCITEFGKEVTPRRRLWSLADSTMTHSWQRSGQLKDWLELSVPLYQSLDILNIDDADTYNIALSYLCTLSWVREDEGQIDESIVCYEEILWLVEKYAIKYKSGFGAATVAFGRMLRIYRDSGEERKQNETLNRLLAFSDDVKKLANDDEGYVDSLYSVYHNLSLFLLNNGFGNEAISACENALSIREDAMTRLYYAGALLQGRNDYEGALNQLKRAVNDPRSSTLHAMEEFFLSAAFFEPVHKDPEFLAVVQGAQGKFTKVGEKGITPS